MILYISKYYDFSRKYNESIPFWNHGEKEEEEREVHDDSDKAALRRGPGDHYLTRKISASGKRDSWIIRDYIVDTTIFTLTVLVGYALMLIFMTYNVLLCAMVLIGYALGRLIFYRKVRSMQEFVEIHSKKQVMQAGSQQYYTNQSHDHCNLEN